MKTITGLDELKAAEGEVLGTTEWHEVTQEAIDDFADVTGDHQWIHVDVERAKDTPFGGTIAHGYYTLSLAPMFTEQVMSLEGFAFAVNYGLNKVRFPAPVPVGSRVRVDGQAGHPRGDPRRRADHARADVRASRAARSRPASRRRWRGSTPASGRGSTGPASPAKIDAVACRRRRRRRGSCRRERTIVDATVSQRPPVRSWICTSAPTRAGHDGAGDAGVARRGPAVPACAPPVPVGGALRLAIEVK